MNASDYWNGLKTFVFGHGKHKSRKHGLCVMEAVALLAGEKHSDEPACADPVITKLSIWVNDSCSDSLRQELLAGLPYRIVGTKATAEIEQQRAFMAADWAVRFVCPILLERAGLKDQADSLRCHAPVTDSETAESAYAAAYAARAAARAGAGAAARAAAYAAYAAAYAARAGAGAAARAAACAAADDLEIIQRSCAELLDLMIRLTEPQERVIEAAAERSAEARAERWLEARQLKSRA